MPSEHKNPKNQMSGKTVNSKKQKSPPQKKNFSKPNKSSRLTSNTINISEILAPLAEKHSILSVKSKEEEFEFLNKETKSPSRPTDQNGAMELQANEHSSGKPGDPAFRMALGMLKGVLFKRDEPYRTYLPLQGLFSTNGSGVVNLTISNLSLASTAEWATITALFDEFYVHTIVFKFVPVNVAGGGMGQCGSAGVVGPQTAIADTSYTNCGLLCCCLFNAGAQYTSASAMAANATIAIKHTGKGFTYKWRNNVRFEKHGLAIPTISGGGWSGWMNVGGVAQYGGNIQFRTLNDQVVGSGSAIVNMGQYIARYEVSFRCRS